MNLTSILFEPYVIIIILALVITLIAYFVIQNDNKDKEDDEDKINIGTSLLYTFLGSFLIMMLGKLGFSYMNKNNMFQKGGAVINNNRDISEKLTIVADDVDFGLFEDN